MTATRGEGRGNRIRLTGPLRERSYDAGLAAPPERAR